jgi:hypothetical protein
MLVNKKRSAVSGLEIETPLLRFYQSPRFSVVFLPQGVEIQLLRSMTPKLHRLDSISAKVGEKMDPKDVFAPPVDSVAEVALGPDPLFVEEDGV